MEALHCIDFIWLKSSKGTVNLSRFICESRNMEKLFLFINPTVHGISILSEGWWFYPGANS